MTFQWFPFGLKPKDNADDGPRYADLYERGVASGIDVLLIFSLLTHPFYSLQNYIYRRDPVTLMNLSHPHTLGQLLQLMLNPLWQINLAVQAVIIGIFYVGCQLVFRTTPGKWLTGLQIVDATTLQPIGGWRYVWRYLCYFPAAPLFMIVSFDKKRRGLHDYLAHTRVVHIRPKGWYWQQFKLGVRWGWQKLNSPPAEQAVGQPPAEQRDEDGAKPE